MTAKLLIGDRAYSSWSLRGWLLFARFGLDVDVDLAHLLTDGFATALEGYAPAKTVPAAKIDGAPISDSLALLEHLNDLHPGAGFWPEDLPKRAIARSLVAEMHASFATLRTLCPMNLHRAYLPAAEIEEDLARDLERLQTLWALARSASGTGPWLFGQYTAVDAFFAPVAARIATYALPMEPEDLAYVETHLADPPFRRWRAMALADPVRMERYEFDRPERPWPGPVPLPAAVAEGPAINTACPFSGRPVVADGIAEIGGVRVGFCNRFCREKVIADPLAWPEVGALLAPHLATA
ncbi:MAG: glutathione S-transferase [Pseudomonadota bacterium]